ncbi:MAG: QueT transporter family protein [Halanaerobiales bacterium]|nr:QueT transporter family protein [Halanaerobiales bacterium]
MQTKQLVRGGIIAAIYVVLTMLLAPISFQAIQLRVSEALTVLPILFPEAVPALFVGVLISNILGGLGLADIIGGSLTTLIAAYLTYRYRKSIIAYLSPVVLNAFLISIYLHIIFGLPYWLNVIAIGVSEALVVFLIGYPLIQYLKRKQIKKALD